jgi:hypothetical protein
MTRIYIKEPKHMKKRELERELEAIRSHMDNFGVGRWEFQYERELMDELNKRYPL